MSENHREPEVPEAGVPVVECLDGLARITLEELAITHFVKDGTLQNASSTRPRVVVGLRMPSRKDGPPSIWDTHGLSGSVFVNLAASSFALSAGIESMEFRNIRTDSLINGGEE